MRVNKVFGREVSGECSGEDDPRQGLGRGWWGDGRMDSGDKRKHTQCLAQVPSPGMAAGRSHHVVTAASQIEEEPWKEHEPLDSRAGSVTR